MSSTTGSTYRIVTVIQEVFHVVLGLGEYLREHFGQGRYRREVMLLQHGQFPTRGTDRAGCHRRRIGRTVRVGLFWRVFVTLDHDHATRMSLEQVVDERNDNDDTGRRRGESQAGQSLDEACDQGGGEKSDVS